MANSTWLPRIAVPATKDDTTNLSQHQPRSRPLPLRVRTFSQSTPPTSPADQRQGRFHARNNSFTSSPSTPSDQTFRHPHGSYQSSEPSDIFDSPRGSLDSNDSSPTYNYPATPETSLRSARNSLEVPAPEILPFDFTQIDYELSRAKVLGEGLWSTVYLAEQKPGISSSPSPSPQSRRSRSIPSISFSTKLRVRQQTTSTLFAIKTPTRPDSPIVFRNEAKILTHLQRRSLASHHIVTFHGYDPRNSSLAFEALFGGSLESLNSRLKQMTEVARHLEIISLFPGLAVDLIGGLEFLHANGVVHADIKAGNVLLDISEHATDGRPVIRARYIDFSAAFLAGEGEGEAGKYAGGTWDYMAPEQMRPRATPTFASDVWSLGVTLLVVLCGGSPWSAACGGNNFMLREAVKSGDAVGFARMDSTVKKRLDAVQDLVDCCRFALKKEPEKRISSAAWAGWVEGWSDGQEVEMLG